ncbi:MAG: tetratricopeptide repeat protein [Desulfatibacillaceae bacterium]|nr:tetratricopeptide repeat protein [Desulfatibacillaceae bacterium]
MTRWQKKPGLVAAFIFLVVVIAYLPSFFMGFIWDDDAHVIASPENASFSALAKTWLTLDHTQQYYPLTHSVFWLQYRLWGHWAAGYHAVNIFLHGILAFLIWRIFALMGYKGALAGALLFALHPVAVESVTWISELKNVLSGALLAASLLWLCSFLNLFSKPSPLKPSSVYTISFAIFLCALAAKTTSSVLPVFALALVYWRRGKVSKSVWMALVPFFVAGLVAGLTTIHVEKEFIIGSEDYFETLDMPARLVIAGKAVWFYLSKLVWPANLVFIYPKFDRQVSPEAFLPLAAVGLVFAVLFLLRKKIGRGPICAWACYFAALFPALGFFDVYPFIFSFVADHFQYLAMPVFCIFAGGLWAAARQRAPQTISQFMVAALCLILIVLTVQTWRTQLPYQNHKTLWEEVLKHNPDVAMAHNNLAAVFFEDKEYGKAIFHWQNAIRLNPGKAKAYVNIGWALLDLEFFLESRDAFAEAVRIEPDSQEAWMGLGFARMGLAKMGLETWDAAINAMEQAVSIDPGAAPAHHNMGVVLGKAGQYEKALTSLEKARSLNPKSVVTLVDLYHVLMKQNNPDEADKVWIQLKLLDPALARKTKIIYEHQQDNRFQDMPQE